jgi:hypothetical protein
MQIGSTVGTGGGTNRPVQLGHFNSAGAFTSGLSVSTTGVLRLGRIDGVLGNLKVTSSNYITTLTAEFGDAAGPSNFHFGTSPIATVLKNTDINPNNCSFGRNGLCVGYSTNASISYRNDYPSDYVPGIFSIEGNNAWASAVTNTTGGQVRFYGGSGATGGQAGAVVLAHTGSATRGRVLVGTATDDGINLLQVAGAITASGNLNLTALPTSDPGVSGRVWRDGTNLRISV